jgi:hypothetical protein
VFLDDIVDDEVLPYLSLAVDGLTESRENKSGKLELRPEDLAANEEVAPDTTMPVAALNAEDFIEVYGWETSWWKKIKGYFGFYDLIKRPRPACSLPAWLAALRFTSGNEHPARGLSSTLCME